MLLAAVALFEQQASHTPCLVLWCRPCSVECQQPGCAACARDASRCEKCHIYGYSRDASGACVECTDRRCGEHTAQPAGGGHAVWLPSPCRARLARCDLTLPAARPASMLQSGAPRRPTCAPTAA